MAKKIIAVNASPRKGWNTDTLVAEAAKGARQYSRKNAEKLSKPEQLWPERQALWSGRTLR
ncbi:MAG: hypothetical protein Q4A48_01370 [Bacillota bacterium]|nr:hypothetical protein [Bacillota bacterium]